MRMAACRAPLHPPVGLRQFAARPTDRVDPIPISEQTKPKRKAARPARRAKAAVPVAGFVPLSTERLTLRPLQATDAEALHRLVNDWEVTRTLAELPYPYPRELADDWIASTLRQIADGLGLSSGHHRA